MSHNDDTTPAISGFLAKTFDIFSDPANYDLCSWGPGGDTIIVKRIDDFSKIILPRHFKHSNFQSFVRQLNMYDFHKTIADPSNGQFHHVFFLEGRRDLLHLIKRKAHNQRTTVSSAESSKKSAVPLLGDTSGYLAPAENVAMEGDESLILHPSGGGMSDIVQHKVLKTDLDRRLREIEKQQHRIRDLENTQAKIIRENMRLHHMLKETHDKQLLVNEKMEKVLKLLYCVYTKQPLSRVVNSVDSTSAARITNGTDASFSDICNYLQLDIPFTKKQNLLEDSPHLEHPNLGNPLTRGGSFDIAASSVLPPHGSDFMSFPSFSGAPPLDYNSSTSVGNDGLGKPLGRMHSLDPYAYPPTWMAASSVDNGDASSSEAKANEGILNTFLNKVSTASAVPLLEHSPLLGTAIKKEPTTISGIKREAGDYEESSEFKKVKTDHANEILEPDALGTPIGDPLDKSNSSFFSNAVSNLLENNPDITLQRLDSLEATLSTLMEGEDEHEIGS